MSCAALGVVVGMLPREQRIELAQDRHRGTWRTALEDRLDSRQPQTRGAPQAQTLQPFFHQRRRTRLPKTQLRRVKDLPPKRDDLIPPRIDRAANRGLQLTGHSRTQGEVKRF